ncbi:hypothetical protein [Rathayibacter sp. VKM Ac-2928]|uniref:hypothetical protein n=1 Tax=Rathayibacter sp. VKM Ac-2928 TaxID=2929479 RepID=UPI001FB1E7ED|nr:hypothetical protein [Rathayibacter sp. VKM Ac-2928]MCJ1685368.1 hypothetical protein [Rathayibacter sp. VKM Ac-2928]
MCAVVVGLIGIAPTASAEEVPADEESYCLAVVDGSVDSAEQACADTESGVYEAAYTQLGILYDDGTKDAESFIDSIPLNRGAQAAAIYYPLGTIYDNINYGGSALTFSSQNLSACAPSYPEVKGDLGVWGWDNRLSSFKGTQCTVTLFDGKYQGGAGYGPNWQLAWVGSTWNDRASSILFWN